MGVCTSAPLSSRLKIIPVIPMYSVAAPRSWLSHTLDLAAGPASAAIVTATTPMMLDWIVKKLKKLKKFTTLLPMLMVLASWVMIAATTAAAIASRSTLPMVRAVIAGVQRQAFGVEVVAQEGEVHAGGADPLLGVPVVAGEQEGRLRAGAEA